MEFLYIINFSFVRERLVFELCTSRVWKSFFNSGLFMRTSLYYRFFLLAQFAYHRPSVAFGTAVRNVILKSETSLGDSTPSVTRRKSAVAYLFISRPFVPPTKPLCLPKDFWGVLDRSQIQELLLLHFVQCEAESEDGCCVTTFLM